jgi:hypothetical protein
MWPQWRSSLSWHTAFLDGVMAEAIHHSGDSISMAFRSLLKRNIAMGQTSLPWNRNRHAMLEGLENLVLRFNTKGTRL